MALLELVKELLFFMNAVSTKKSPTQRWVNRYLPFWIMAVGFIAAIVFVGLAQWSADAWMDTEVEKYAWFAMFASCIFLAGCFLCVISNLWLLTSTVAFLIRRKCAKRI